MKTMCHALILVLTLLVPAPTQAQGARGTITGRVVDALGGVLPGASVKVTNLTRNTSVSAVTNGEGRFQVNDLPPGSYLVTVELQGFANYVQDRIQVRDDQTVDLPIALALGAASESITVTGFRESQQQSLDLKREAVHSRESIVAEDIGKMPDLNLAVAIQRVPSVTIDRDVAHGLVNQKLTDLHQEGVSFFTRFRYGILAALLIYGVLALQPILLTLLVMFSVSAPVLQASVMAGLDRADEPAQKVDTWRKPRKQKPQPGKAIGHPARQ